MQLWTKVADTLLEGGPLERIDLRRCEELVHKLVLPTGTALRNVLGWASGGVGARVRVGAERSYRKHSMRSRKRSTTWQFLYSPIKNASVAPRFGTQHEAAKCWHGGG